MRPPTARQREAIALLAEGSTNKEIAVHLGFTGPNAEQVVKNLFFRAGRRLGIRGRVNLLIWWLRQGGKIETDRT